MRHQAPFLDVTRLCVLYPFSLVSEQRVEHEGDHETVSFFVRARPSLDPGRLKSVLRCSTRKGDPISIRKGRKEIVGPT